MMMQIEPCECGEQYICLCGRCQKCGKWRVSRWSRLIKWIANHPFRK